MFRVLVMVIDMQQLELLQTPEMNLHINMDHYHAYAEKMSTITARQERLPNK